MDPTEKEIIDKLFRGEITIPMASKELGVSIDDVHRIVDDYEYVPTIDEECEVQKAILENLTLLNNEFGIKKNVQSPKVDVTTASEVYPRTQFDMGRRELQLPNANGDYPPSTPTPYDSYYHG